MKLDINFEELVGIAERDNNRKRNYLYVNRLQGKHIPVSPEKCIRLFTQLGERVNKEAKNEKITVIGFAETATAIGATIASHLGNNIHYIHTTREDRFGIENTVNFEEEHSHATEQKLYCIDAKRYLYEADRLIFVEDEISTGKTILNFIHSLKNNKYIKDNQVIEVVSIINGMVENDVNKFDELGINSNFLIKIQNHKQILEFPIKESNWKDKDISNIKTQIPIVEQHEIKGNIDPRLGISVHIYEEAIKKLEDSILDIINHKISENTKLLVLGTEEFMYPAIKVAYAIEKKWGNEVKVHATTRSPILPKKDLDYPIESRFELRSFYEESRKTFIYNLDYYDKVIIISDTDNVENWNLGFNSLVDKLKDFGCREIYGIRWIK